MNEEYIQGIADKISADWKRKKAFEGRRNRSAWKRMNRPKQLEAQERGADKMMKLLDRGKPVNEGIEKDPDGLPVDNEYTGP